MEKGDEYMYGYIGDKKYGGGIVFQKDKKTNDFIKNIFPNWEYVKVTKEQYENEQKERQNNRTN